MCDCLSVVARLVIAILSVLFTILGFGLLVLGIIAKVAIEQLSTLYTPLLENAKAQAQAQAGTSITLPTDSFNIQELVDILAIVLIVIGVLMVAIGIFGMIGACCMVKCMAIAYLVIVGVFFLTFLIVVIILAVDKKIITDVGRGPLTDTLQTKYTGLNGTDVTSLTWNLIMSSQQCCGISNNNDFNPNSVWYAIHGPGTTSNFQLPAVCCKPDAFNPPTDTTCTTEIAPANNKDTGCYDLILDMFLTGSLFIGAACGVVGFFGLLTFFAAVIVYKAVKKNKVNPL